MATNLRLRRDAEEAVRVEAARTGRSQQELIRAAIDAYLGLRESHPRSEADALIAGRSVLPARSPFVEVDADDMVPLPDGATTLDLLDRDERF
jgi:plasmid stability protein